MNARLDPDLGRRRNKARTIPDSTVYSRRKVSHVGLIRKTLMISTAGIVRGSSKKQRVAKASLRQLRQQTRLQEQAIMQQQAAAQQPAPPAAAPAPGWYPSPAQPGRMQWWDGSQWTPSVQ